MSSTRRALTRSLILAPAIAAMLRPGTSAAQGVHVGATEWREQFERAQSALPANNPRARVATERTMARLDDLGIDFAAPRLIVVNIAAAEVMAFEEGREVMRSRVVVGAGRTRTPQLLTFATTVRTNPPWHVPPSIIAEIRASGAAGFQAVGNRLIQPPGPNNPLGPLRIGLLDSDGIFLHGTNRPGLFGRDGRSLSHGCVRVERIHDLSAWVLDVSVGEVRAAAATGRTMELYPTREVQVALAYLTAWPDSAGRMAIHADPYGLDAPGARRASVRRVYRDTPDDPIEVEAAARATLAAAGRM
jgi:murein L,D-transpeptidase YcbB/YkuD